MNDELKPCPFCGEKAETRYESSDSSSGSWWKAGCGRCHVWLEIGTHLTHNVGDYPTEEEVIAAWNTRCYPDTPRKLADFLVAHGLIDAAAVEDPEGYDNGRTMHLIAQAAEDLNKGPA